MGEFGLATARPRGLWVSQEPAQRPDGGWPHVRWRQPAVSARRARSPVELFEHLIEVTGSTRGVTSSNRVRHGKLTLPLADAGSMTRIELRPLHVDTLARFSAKKAERVSSAAGD